ncbi:hypothetical protein ACFVVU_23310 [Kitasatospora sp. NPDC057965]|uniref:hypothetical protein n=1 Tax=Kitasatospora sp. NPDC057965 TaxID=3346291 RepID=UPI0036DDD42E
MNVKRIAAVAAILAGGLGTAVAAPAASAAEAASVATIGSCDYTYACLFYNSSGVGLGAQFAHAGDIHDYAGSYFSAGPYGSSGAGVAVKNHAASVANQDAHFQITIFQRSGDVPWGNRQVIPPLSFRDLTTVKNDNAAGTWQYVG